MALDFSASIAYKCYRDRLRYVCRGCELHHITDAAQFGATDGESRLLHLIRAVRYCNVVILHCVQCAIYCCCKHNITSGRRLHAQCETLFLN